ncbi:MAG: anti-sigma factor family protein [Burkholderiales bacterium]
MNCAHAAQLLDAYLDGEVDAATRLDMAEHLAVCPACTVARAAREALVQRARAAAPRHAAPAGLVYRLRKEAETRARPGRLHGLRWLPAAAVVLAVAAGSAALGYHAGRSVPAPPPFEALVASHVASLTPGTHLLDVGSGDRHTVKPWLQGRIDFAPAVRDLAAQGYLLLGARLDRVDTHPAAAIVYRIRNHVINLYVWRAEDGRGAPPAFARARGYGVATWTESGLAYAAISDVDRRDLEAFSQLVREPPRQ